MPFTEPGVMKRVIQIVDECKCPIPILASNHVVPPGYRDVCLFALARGEFIERRNQLVMNCGYRQLPETLERSLDFEYCPKYSTPRLALLWCQP